MVTTHAFAHGPILLLAPFPTPPPKSGPPLAEALGLYLPLTCDVGTSCLMQVNHNQSLETPFPTDAIITSPSTPTPSGRRLTAASTHTSHKGMSLGRASVHDRTFSEHAIMSELMMDSQAAVLTHVSHKRTTLDSASAHDMMTELMVDSKAGLRKLGPARGLLSAAEEEFADLWFGYDVHYRSRPVQRDYGSFAPRYVGSRNQVLGGLYFQQVRGQSMLGVGNCVG